MNDYESHLSSYDHSHKQRLKDMKAMVRDPNAGARARKAEAKADGIVSIKLAGQDAAPSAGSGGFKKGGFKKSGFKSAFAPADAQAAPAASSAAAAHAATKPEPLAQPLGSKSLLEESDTEDDGYEAYDPRFPTD
jgi:hypothetical protein